MKGGKAGRKRASSANKRGKPTTPAQKKQAGVKREENAAPKKGSRKNTRFGGMSSSGED